MELLIGKWICERDEEQGALRPKQDKREMRTV